MLPRLLSSLVGLPLLVFCIFWHGGLLYIAGIILLSLIGLSEFFAACQKQGLRPLTGLGIATALLLLLEAAVEEPRTAALGVSAILTACVLAALIGELIRNERVPVRDLGATFVGVLYGGWLFRYLILLRTHGELLPAAAGGHDRAPWLGDPGAWAILLVIAATWAGDSAAFFIGRAFGKRPLAPAISPGKTVEGALAGLLAAVLMALALGAVLGLDLLRIAGLGLLIGLLSPVGDLSESAIKRELGLKDFSGLLPGHGGVLDRFDSLLFTAPVVYYLLSLVNG